MSLHLSACAGCGTAYFPPRMRCHRCGGFDFEPRACAVGTVTGVSRVHRIPEGCDFGYLVEVEAGEGVVVVAVARRTQTLGARVALAQADTGAVCVAED